MDNKKNELKRVDQKDIQVDASGSVIGGVAIDESLGIHVGGPNPTINTGGGTYVGGNVSAGGGDFVGRDSIHFTGGGNVIGHNNRALVSKTSGESETTAMHFEQALARARQKPIDIREEVEEAVKTAKEETEAGENADRRLLSKALDVLLDESPDVLELVINAILNPGAAASSGARMLARHARGALEKRHGDS